MYARSGDGCVIGAVSKRRGDELDAIGQTSYTPRKGNFWS